jgi:hypothetical protein
MTQKTTESIAEVVPSEPLKCVLGIYFAAHRRVLPTRFELPSATLVGRVTVISLKAQLFEQLRHFAGGHRWLPLVERWSSPAGEGWRSQP